MLQPACGSRIRLSYGPDCGSSREGSSTTMTRTLRTSSSPEERAALSVPASCYLPRPGGSWVQAEPLSSGGRVSRVRRHIHAAVNPISTAATRWWCRSALRHMLTGYGPMTRQRRLIRHGMIRGGVRTPSAVRRRARARRSTSCSPRDGHEFQRHNNSRDRPGPPR